MRNLLKLFIALILLGASAFAAQAGEGNLAADARLSQLVTITSTGKRLHFVVADIAAQTGVKISCGNSKDDWPVRDIPVVVMVKNMPLGKLLKNIADVTHLTLGSEKLEGKLRYRIYRSSKQQKELDTYYADVRKAALDAAAWDWDVACKLASEQKLEMGPHSGTETGQEFLDSPLNKCCAKVLNLLGIDGKNRVLAGENIILNSTSGSQELRELVKTTAQAGLAEINESLPRIRANLPDSAQILEPEPDFIDKSGLRIIYDETPNELPDIRISVTSPRFSISKPLSTIADFVSRAKGIKTTPRPEMPPLPGKDAEKSKPVPQPNPEIAKLWEKKAKIDPPKDKETPLFSDLLQGIAKAYEINIIAEDFTSYSSLHSNLRDSFGKKLTLAELLYRKLKWNLTGDGLLIGSETDWPDHYRDLIPEALFGHLCDKANGDGIILEDALVVTDLTPKQAYQWIINSKELGGSGLGAFCTSGLNRSLWRLYYHLNSEQRAQAESEGGLSLQKFDSKWVKDELLPELLHCSPELPSYLGIADYNEKPVESVINDMSGISLHLQKSVVGDRTSYELSLNNRASDGQLYNFSEGYAGPFPCYTYTRAARLAAQAANKEGTTPPVAKQ